MSTAYHIHCKTCHVTVTGGWENHPETPAAILQNRAYFWQLAALMSAPPSGISFEFGRGSFCIGYSDERFDFEAFAKHAEHDLVVMDEYGYELDACWERFTCDGCGSQHSCADKKGHEGPHRTREELRKS